MSVDLTANNLLVASSDRAFLVPSGTDKKRCSVSLRVVGGMFVVHACPGFELGNNVIAAIIPVSSLQSGVKITCVHNGQQILFGTVSKVLCFPDSDAVATPEAGASTAAQSKAAAPLGKVTVTAAAGIDGFPSPIPEVEFLTSPAR